MIHDTTNFPVLNILYKKHCIKKVAVFSIFYHLLHTISTWYTIDWFQNCYEIYLGTYIYLYSNQKAIIKNGECK